MLAATAVKDTASELNMSQQGMNLLRGSSVAFILKSFAWNQNATRFAGRMLHMTLAIGNKTAINAVLSIANAVSKNQ
jgi:hypothetical protein